MTDLSKATENRNTNEIMATALLMACDLLDAVRQEVVVAVKLLEQIADKVCKEKK